MLGLLAPESLAPAHATTSGKRGSTLNIASVFDLATPADIAAGRMWYADARQSCERLAQKHEYTLEQVAGVVAALSPHCPWGRNLLDAANVLRSVNTGTPEKFTRVSTFGLNKEKAFRIARGEPPADVLRGPKVTSFFTCLMQPDHPTAVVVDGHAVAIWSGDYHPVSEMRIWLALYRRIADDYRALAAELGELPSIVQATTWLVWHRLHQLNSQEAT